MSALDWRRFAKCIEEAEVTKDGLQRVKNQRGTVDEAFPHENCLLTTIEGVLPSKRKKRRSPKDGLQCVKKQRVTIEGGLPSKNCQRGIIDGACAEENCLLPIIEDGRARTESVLVAVGGENLRPCL